MPRHNNTLTQHILAIGDINMQDIINEAWKKRAIDGIRSVLVQVKGHNGRACDDRTEIEQLTANVIGRRRSKAHLLQSSCWTKTTLII
jgi:hypothetical protein